MATTTDDLLTIDFASIADPDTAQAFEARIREGAITRDENLLSHICAYTLPYNPSSKRVLFGYHRKAKLWLAPGGHIDRGETLAETVVRELKEELGLSLPLDHVPAPFFASITDIDNPPQVCRRHYDIWHLIEVSDTRLTLDPREFPESRWLTFEEARSVLIDPSNLQALDRLTALRS